VCRCIALCQCVAACCSVLQCVAVRCSVWQCAAALQCASVLQLVATCLQVSAMYIFNIFFTGTRRQLVFVLQCELRCVAVC